MKNSGNDIGIIAEMRREHWRRKKEGIETEPDERSRTSEIWYPIKTAH